MHVITQDQTDKQNNTGAYYAKHIDEPDAIFFFLVRQPGSANGEQFIFL
jgi:hypothetical protein